MAVDSMGVAAAYVYFAWLLVGIPQGDYVAY